MARRLLCFLASLSLLGAAPVAGQNVNARQIVRDFSHVVILMDASGSMEDQRLSDGQLNWTMAKNHSARLIEAIVQETQTPFAVVHFGANQPRFGVCTEGVEVPMGPATDSRASQAISSIAGWTPNGKTSLAAGLEIAWQQLEATGGMIVVFTDFEADNCEGDPCRTVERLTRARGENKPPIEIRFVVSIGPQGFQTSREFGDCSGAKTLPAEGNDDIDPNVLEIIEPLRSVQDAKVNFSMQVLDVAGLGVSLPPQSTATLLSGANSAQSLGQNTIVDVTADKAEVEVLLPLADPFRSGVFDTPQGTTAKVHTYFTPPLLHLSLPDRLVTDEVKWSLIHAQSNTRYLFTGPRVERYLPAGDYTVEVWVGETYLKNTIVAQWNTASEHVITR